MELDTTIADLRRWLRPVLDCAAAGAAACDAPVLDRVTVVARGRQPLLAGARGASAAVIGRLERPGGDDPGDGADGPTVRVTLKATALRRAVASFGRAEDVRLTVVGADGAGASDAQGGGAAGLSIRCGRTGDEQRLAGIPGEVVMPGPVGAPARALTIGRTDLLDAARVARVVDPADPKPRFRRWMLRLLTGGGYRSVGGSGARFVVRERHRPGVAAASAAAADTAGDAGGAPGTAVGASCGDLLIARAHTRPLVTALAGSDAADVLLTEHPGAGVLAARCGGTVVLLTGHEPTAGWVDEMRFVDRASPCRVVTRLADWRLPLRGLRATPPPPDGVRRAELTAGPGGRALWLRSPDGGAARSVPVLDARWPTGGGQPALRFTVATRFLGEMSRRAAAAAAAANGDGGFVQLEFDDAAPLMVVRYGAGGTVQDEVWRTGPCPDEAGVRDRVVMVVAGLREVATA